MRSLLHCAFSSVVYLLLGSKAANLLGSPNPKVVVPLPKREKVSGTSSSESTKRAARKPATNEEGWISSNSAAKKKAKRSTSKATTGTKKKAASKTTTTAKKRRSSTSAASKKNKARKTATSKKKSATIPVGEVIELCTDDEDDSVVSKVFSGAPAAAPEARPRSTRNAKAIAALLLKKDDLWDESDESEEEAEFEG